MAKTMKFMQQQINSKMKQNAHLQRELRRLSTAEFIKQFGKEVHERQKSIARKEERMRRRELEQRSKSLDESSDTSENSLLQAAMELGIDLSGVVSNK